MKLARLRRQIFVLPVTLGILIPLSLAWQRPAPAGGGTEPAFLAENNVAVPMRDGVILRANVWRPRDDAKHAVLVYRTPYGKREDTVGDTIFAKAVARGYVVVMQDVRGRYASDGEFNPYFQEGKDGYDTIEWAARQPWSDGNVGTFGLSYPGAVQWLAAIESPPHLKAMVPAMTFSTPRNFFYSGGVFDGSWIGWIWSNIAPDARVKKNLTGPKNGREARQAGREAMPRMQRVLPLSAMTDLRDVAPWYYEWLRHGPEEAYWDSLDLRDKYARVSAAVLNFSGWYDEAYGPEGATTNFMGLAAARKGQADPRNFLILGPWVHGVPGRSSTKAGERDFTEAAYLDYDEVVLRFLDRYVRGIPNGVELEPRVRAFVMGENRWRSANTWPLPDVQSQPYYLTGVAGTDKPGTLTATTPRKGGESYSSFISDAAQPVVDEFPPYTGGHDYSKLAQQQGVLVWETAPLGDDVEIVGHITAEIYLSCDAPDTDLWVRLHDVEPSGKAINLMSPGLDVQRASYRNPFKRELLQPGKVYKLELKNLLTGNTFRKGHRIRVQISASFFPNFSRNLHSGKLETTESGETRRATITIHHDAKHPSRILLPVLQNAGATRPR